MYTFSDWTVDRAKSFVAAHPKYEWCCERGCGPCGVRSGRFEFYRSETLDGDLIESRSVHQLVSACCGFDVALWNSEAQDFVEDVSALPAATSKPTPDTARSAD